MGTVGEGEGVVCARVAVVPIVPIAVVVGTRVSVVGDNEGVGVKGGEVGIGVAVG